MTLWAICCFDPPDYPASFSALLGLFTALGLENNTLLRVLRLRYKLKLWPDSTMSLVRMRALWTINMRMVTVL